MMQTPKTIRVEPNSELDRILSEVDEVGVELERAGVRYRLERVASETTAAHRVDYDPEKALAGMRAAAGSWNDIDAERLKGYLDRAREEGSRPLDRP